MEKVIQENDNVLFQALVKHLKVINHDLQKDTEHCIRNCDACVCVHI